MPLEFVIRQGQAQACEERCARTDEHVGLDPRRFVRPFPVVADERTHPGGTENAERDVPLVDLPAVQCSGKLADAAV